MKILVLLPVLLCFGLVTARMNRVTEISDREAHAVKGAGYSTYYDCAFLGVECAPEAGILVIGESCPAVGASTDQCITPKDATGCTEVTAWGGQGWWWDECNGTAHGVPCGPSTIVKCILDASEGEGRWQSDGAGALNCGAYSHCTGT